MPVLNNTPEAKKRRLYIIAAIAAPLCGAMVQVLAGDSLFSIWDVPVALFSLLLVFEWYRIDTDTYGLKRRIWGNSALVFLTIIVLPVHLFKTRGTLKGALASMFFLFLNIAWLGLEAFGAKAITLISSI